MKRYLVFLNLICGSIFADDHSDFDFDTDLSYYEDNSDESDEPKIEYQKPQRPAQAKQQKAQKQKSNSVKENEHSYYASPDSHNRVFTSISYLYWTASQPGLHYAAVKSNPIAGFNEPAINSSIGNGAATSLYAVGEIKKGNFNWTSGVRANVSYHFGKTHWEVVSDYTYLNMENMTRAERPNTSYSYLTGLSQVQQTFVLCDHAKSKLNLTYQNAKLGFASSWEPFKQGLFRLSFGPHATFLKHDWEVAFYPINAVSPVIPNINATCFNKYENSSWALGLYGDIGYEAHLGRGFSLMLEGYFAAMSGQKKVHSYDVVLNSTYTGYTSDFDLWDERHYEFMGQGMLSCGLFYSRSYDKFAFKIGASYEFNALINMIDIYQTTGATNTLSYSALKDQNYSASYQNPTIYLQGLTAKVGFGF